MRDLLKGSGREEISQLDALQALAEVLLCHGLVMGVKKQCQHSLGAWMLRQVLDWRERALVEGWNGYSLD